jgi:hypothetical protein
MRLTILALLLAAATSAAEIPKGSHTLLRMVNSVTTRTAREGDYVYLRTATPIVANGSVLVPVDSYVQGIVTHSKRSGRVKGVAELGIRIETLTFPTGKVVKMTPSLTSVDSDGTDQKVVGKESTVGAGVGSAVGLATVLLTRGREVELKQGATIDVTFDRPVPLD